MRNAAAIATAASFAAFGLAAPADAADPMPADPMQADPMQLVGQATFHVGPFAVYDAALFAPDGDFVWEQPFALTLTYRLALDAEDIARVSIEEMARAAGGAEADFAALRPSLEACFADVTKGDHLTGMSASADSATFYHNGEKRCDIAHPGFRDAFFGIWLGEDTRRPDLTAELTGRDGGTR